MQKGDNRTWRDQRWRESRTEGPCKGRNPLRLGLSFMRIGQSRHLSDNLSRPLGEGHGLAASRGLLPEEKVAELGRQIEASSDFPEGYIFRRVSDVGSLVEKVNIFDAGLDDTVLEMCKYVTRMEMAGKAGEKDLVSAQLKFYRTDGPDNDIEFSYPLNGQMHGVRIGFNVYGDCAGILRRNPSIKPSGGFPVVDQAWIARFFG